MASLMTMDFTQFVTEFLPNEKYDYTKYDIIIISKDITGSLDDDTNKYNSKYDNIDFAFKLFPLPMVMNFIVEHKHDHAREAYMNQLEGSYSDIAMDVWAICDLIVNSKRDIILVCSFVESKYKYLHYLMEYIDINFKIPGITFDEFKKFDGNTETINFEESAKLIEFRKTMMEEDEETIVFNRFTESLADRFRDILLQRTIPELREFCKSRGIFVKRTNDNIEMVEYILDKLKGQSR